MEKENSVRVETYDGYKSPENPRAVYMLGKKYDVLKVIKAWRAQREKNGLLEEHFKVELKNYGECEIIYNHEFQNWQIKK